MRAANTTHIIDTVSNVVPGLSGSISSLKAPSRDDGEIICAVDEDESSKAHQKAAST